MGFELLCATLIALLFGVFICFAGYRFFMVLLPIWGFFFGFGLGAQTVQVLLGDAFFATVTSWAVGLVVAILFAVLSYLFYIIAVAVISGSLGYGVTVALLTGIGMSMNFIVWAVAIVVAVVVAVIVLRFNLAKYAIIIATGLGGAALTIATLLLGVEGIDMATAVENPVRAMLSGSWFWTLIFLAMAVLGIAAQWRTSLVYDLEPYDNRI